MAERLFNFWMDEALKKELEILAVREGRSLKEILNEQARKYVEVHKEGNPQHLLTSFTENEDFIGFPAIGIEYLKKDIYVKKHCIDDDRLNDFGKELWGHVTQWYHLMRKY